MPKLIFSQAERQIINEDNSFFASRARLFIAKKRFEREVMKSTIGRMIYATLNFLSKTITKNKSCT